MNSTLVASESDILSYDAITESSELTGLRKRDITLSDAAEKVSKVASLYVKETENCRKIAAPVVEQLIDFKLLRMGLPKVLGGLEDNPVETLKVYETLASADASVAWVVWNNHMSCTLGRYLDEDSMKEVYGNPSHAYSNSARPEGVATIAPGGYFVSGQWTIVSGCELADWFILRCLISSPESPVTLDNLGPGANLKLFFIPKSEVEIIDTWHVGGLNGTGSHDVLIKDAFVKEAYAVNFGDSVGIENAYSRLPIGCINAAGCASMALGVMKATMDDMIEVCLNKVTPGKNPDIRDRATVQAVIAKSKTLLESQRLQLHNSVTALWEVTKNNETPTDKQLADVWAASCEAARLARAMTSEIYTVAGISSVYTSFKIEKRHRDIYAILQHGIIQPHWMNQAGMAYVGLKPTAPMFRT